MSRIYIVYEDLTDELYTIESKYLTDEIKAIQEEATIKIAIVDGQILKNAW